MAGPAVADMRETNSAFQPPLGGADSAASQTCPGFSTASYRILNDGLGTMGLMTALTFYEYTRNTVVRPYIFTLVLSIPAMGHRAKYFTLEAKSAAEKRHKTSYSKSERGRTIRKAQNARAYVKHHG
ncbi:hypothetical protein CY34DRAFT_104369 [Suillus luteus UH-Slu-Lm8-n1]|uniref:Uncharacterized protein n=1 Tax=Suillus luteus UH-Slu-Lm8-n1 TaxID=930992 RepID=A0A0D0BXN7_9AGAM|nr:hypothetical protein CY34DRAFT_104369 [Suillus luteus UH-Slu-Lm8-n1]